MKVKFLYFLISCFIILQLSCISDQTSIIEPVVQEKFWLSDPECIFDRKFLLNALFTPSAMYITGLYEFMIMDSTAESGYYINYGSMSNRSVPALCNTYNAYYLIAEDALWVRLNREPFIDLHLPFQEMDSTFSGGVHPANGYCSSPMGLFNNQEELLIVLNDIGGLYLIFIRVEWDGDPDHIKLTSLRKFHFIQAVVYHGMGSIAENFLISLNSGTYKIFPDGSSEKIFDDILLNFYHWQDELFATGLHELYVSRDEGMSWELLANNFPGWAKFFTVNDKLCIYVGDCLYELDLQNMLLRQIDNHGLETNQITAVCEYQDKIYVTTLSGLFYKEKSDFFSYVE